MMKRILFVITELRGGGAERAVSRLSRQFSNNIECDVLVNWTSDEDFPFKGEVISLGMKCQTRMTFSYHIRAAFHRFLRLNKLKKSGKYDVVISFMESANIINVITGRKYCKVVLSVRNNISISYDRGWTKPILWLIKLLYKYADKIVAVSNDARDDLVDNLKIVKGKCITIYNGYNISEFYARGNEGIKENTEYVFITMGRLTYQKAQWHLIRAFSEVKRQMPNARLIILGRGEMENDIRAHIEYYNLENSVDLPGYVTDTVPYLRKADCFIMPSLFEGLCNSVIEAMMQSCKIITCIYGGAAEICDPNMVQGTVIKGIHKGEYGIMIPMCSGRINAVGEKLEVEELIMAEAMIKVATGDYDNLYTSDKIREGVERFSYEKIVGDWEKLIID